MKKSTLSALITAALLGAAVGNANAFSISSTNSTLTGNILGLGNGGQGGSAVPGWVVGGVNRLISQTWWFNTTTSPLNYDLAYPGTVGATYSETVNSASSSTSNYGNVQGFDIGITYSIADNANGSTLTETFNITNTTASTAVFNLFQFTDFDLGSPPFNPLGNNVGNGTNSFNYGENDQISSLGSTVTQTGPGGITVTATGSPTFVSIGQFLALEDAMYNGTIVANGASFTGDAAYVYAYQFNLAAGASAQVVNSTSVVPVPAAAWLFGSGLLGLVGVARRRV